MKKKFPLIIGLPVIVVCLLVACNEEWDTRHSQELSPSYEEEVIAAREFYESLRPLKTRSSHVKIDNSSAMIADMEPRWGKQFTFRRMNKKYRTVESVMYGNFRTSFLLGDVYKKYSETKDSRYKQSMTRLVVQTERATGVRYAFTMTILPSLEYLEKSNFRPYYNTYLKKDKDFSGMILFHELDGSFANGWYYQHGKVTHSISETTLSREEIDEWRSRLARTRSAGDTETECHWVDYYDIIEECKVWCYGNDEFNYYECDDGEEECFTYLEFRESLYECEEVPVTGGEGGGYIPPNNRVYAIPQTLKPLIEKNEIGADIHKLNDVVDTLLKRTSFEQLYKYLIELDFKLNGVKYDPNMAGDAGFTNQGYLKFRNKDFIGVRDIKHEFLHMLQSVIGKYSGNIWQSRNITAVEFERHLFDDICFTMEQDIWSEEDKWYFRYACTDIDEDYREWLSQITYNATCFPGEVPEDIYRKFLRRYWKENISYGEKRGFECDVSSFSPDTLNELLSLISSAYNHQ